MSASQVALAWLRDRDQPMIRLSAAETHVVARQSGELEFVGQTFAASNDASAIEPIFPNSFFANECVRSNVYGGMRDSIDA